MNTMPRRADIREVVEFFHLPGAFVSATPFGSGHINDTYRVTMLDHGRDVRYIVQWINHHVFKNPAALMANLERVTAHLHKKLAAAGVNDTSRRALTLVRARNDASHAVDAEGNTWRCFKAIEGARSYDQIENPRQGYEAARAFGEFQKLLADLPAPRLLDTIPNFHHSRSRFDALRAAIQQDVTHRVMLAQPEIEFALAREAMVDVLLAAHARGEIPERVTHNDTKLNNVLLDDVTGEGVCVIDLDTVMPGLTLYDFGDLCRTATCPTAEDEQDLAKVEMLPEMFAALVQGYLSSAGEFLCSAEREQLVFSARLITFEIGIRFLADFLQGDVYFKTHRAGHNLDRARVQFKMVASFEKNEQQMNALVRAAV
ncbi:MAG: aminoglycoside phosphotransferase family protein [Kiritimatiellaeota bacterium]|nr:aminoglycoside phosphotransferase family protein [Kiritimatiellota bacterium]